MPAHVVKIAGVLVFAVGLSGATSAGVAQITWKTLAPAGGGFSIQVPGEPSSSSKPGHFVDEADDWAYFVTINPVTDAVRELVVAENQGPIKQYLETIHNSFIRRAKETSRSDADFEGYPSIRFSADIETEDKQRFKGRYWLVVTEEHDYMLMAIGPPGASDASAKRFLGSFRLEKTAGPRTGSMPSLASTLKMPMLAVALLITEQRLNPVIDQMLQRSPGAKRAGDRWNPTHPAWPKARTSLSGRVAKVAMAYDETLLRQLWSSVVGKAATEIKGAANLLLFDDSAVISREIEAAIAGVK